MDLSHTIAPKSDQLNADDLIAGDMTISVTDIKASDSPDQPVTINYDGDSGRPYKPCKSMRRVLIQAWGPNGKDWIGKSMTLYRDENVKFGGQAVGGIRISHLSHIDKDMNFMLTVTRARRAAYSVKRLVVQQKDPVKTPLPDPYPAPDFESSFERIVTSIKSGKNTIDKTVKFFADNGVTLTEDQKKRITDATQPDPPVTPTEAKEPESTEMDIF